MSYNQQFLPLGRGGGAEVVGLSKNSTDNSQTTPCCIVYTCTISIDGLVLERSGGQTPDAVIWDKGWEYELCDSRLSLLETKTSNKRIRRPPQLQRWELQQHETCNSMRLATTWDLQQHELCSLKIAATARICLPTVTAYALSYRPSLEVRPYVCF